MKPLNLSEKSPEDRACILAILGPPVEYSYSYDAVKLEDWEKYSIIGTQAERIKELEEAKSEIYHELSMKIDFQKDDIAALTAQRDHALDMLKSADGGYIPALYIARAIAILEGKE